MKIGIVVAMQREAEYVLERLGAVEVSRVASKRIFKAEKFGKEIYIIVGGIGKVNAGMSSQILIDKYGVEKLLNFGFAGGKDKTSQKTGDFVAIKSVCQYDFDLSEIDDVEVGYMQDYDRVMFDCEYEKYLRLVQSVGVCASGDRFTSSEAVSKLVLSMGANVVDMECGAVGEVAHANDIPLVCVKLITDVMGSEGSIFEQYESSKNVINEKFADIIPKIIEVM